MARLLVLWNRPQHLSAVEADGWVRDEIARLALPDVVERVQLTQLCQTATSHPCPGDWLCELHLRDGEDADRCLSHPACAEWLRDLRLLGMRPVVAITRPPGPRR